MTLAAHPEATEATAQLIPPVNQVAIGRGANPKWVSHVGKNVLTIVRSPIFGRSDAVCTIGSCFAERVRVVLQKQGISVGPGYERIDIDPSRFQIDTLPKRPHMNYYNSFTIRQEFERHVGAWKQDADDHWQLKDAIWGGEAMYQDPYRRLVYGRTPADLQDAVKRVNAIMSDAIDRSNVFFFTLGMAEVFRNKRSGKIACQKPMYGGGGGTDETEFYMSSYEENLANMDRVVQIINQVRPGAQIVATVSPVPLSRTFSGEDVVVANTEGKAVLRAALGALARMHANVTYFPSFEIAIGAGHETFIEKDGRHVNPKVVDRIVRAFLEAHLANA